MIREYTLDEIEFELFTPETPADIKRQIELEGLRRTCKQYGLTFTEGWTTMTGRIGLAQVIAAKVSGRHDEAGRVEREWLKFLAGEENG